MRLKKMFISALSGALATVPMTLVMSYFKSRQDDSPLAPRAITMRAAEMVHAKKHLTEKEKAELALTNHFSYGMLMGSLFLPLLGRFVRHRLAYGTLFGLTVWALGYLLWLPLLGLFPKVTQLPLKRNALIVGAHLVWGASLGLLVDSFERKNTLAGFYRP